MSRKLATSKSFRNPSLLDRPSLSSVNLGVADRRPPTAGTVPEARRSDTVVSVSVSVALARKKE